MKQYFETECVFFQDMFIPFWELDNTANTYKGQPVGNNYIPCVYDSKTKKVIPPDETFEVVHGTEFQKGEVVVKKDIYTDQTEFREYTIIDKELVTTVTRVLSKNDLFSRYKLTCKGNFCFVKVHYYEYTLNNGEKVRSIGFYKLNK